MTRLVADWRAEYIARIWELLSIEERWLLVFGIRCGGKLRSSVQTKTVHALSSYKLLRIIEIEVVWSRGRRRIVPTRVEIRSGGQALRTHGRRRLRTEESTR